MVGRNSIATSVARPQTDANENLPASTYAAQLVQKHGTDARPSSGDSSTTFVQLLNAILHNDLDPETDADVNYKVIKLVTDAGLEALPLDDPFAPWDLLLSQAADSIAVIALTLSRQPKLLLLRDGPNPDSGTPMVLWLFAKLMRTAIKPRCEQLLGDIAQLLVSIVDALRTSLDCWHYARAMVQLYQDATNEILRGLGDSQSSRPARPLDIKLPTSHSIVRVSGDSNAATLVSSESQAVVSEASSALKIGVLLLKTTISVIPDRTSAAGDAISADGCLQWARDVAQQILGHILERHNTHTASLAEKLIDQILTILSDIDEVTARDTASPTPRMDEILADCYISCLRSCMEKPFSSDAQQTLSSGLQSLLRKSSPASKVLLQQRVAEVSETASNAEALETDLADVISRIQATPSKSVVNGPAENEARRGEDVVMLDAVSHMNGLSKSAGQGNDFNNTPTGNLFDTAVKCLLKLSLKEGYTRGLDISYITKRSYSALGGHEQEQAWNILATLPCLLADATTDGKCMFCQDVPTLRLDQDAGAWKYMSSPDVATQIANLMRTIMSCKDFADSPRCRILAAVAIRSYVVHCSHAEQLDLSQSALGQWCLKALKAPARDLRFAACRAVSAFLRDDLQTDLRASNRRSALACYRVLTDHPSLTYTETAIHAWGQVIMVCGEDERRLALMQMLNYLGNANHLVSSLAANELEHCATTMGIDPVELCKASMGFLAVAAVREVVSNPKKAILLCEFLKMSTSAFLRSTQRETVPFLVLTKRKDALERVASVAAKSRSIPEVILNPGNFASILALLMSQPGDDPEGFAVAMLAEFLPELDHEDILRSVKIEFVPASVLMFKMASEESPEKRATILRAIQSGAILCQNQGRSRSTQTNSKNAASLISAFFENHVLGMMTHFSETIERKDATLQEKARCLRGMGEMISMAKLDISVAVPQIGACLQSAIDQGGLVDPAISTWLVLMKHLESHDIVPLLDHLFSVIVQNWASISPDLQQQTYDTVAELLKTQNEQIREEVTTVPSLAAIPLMSKFESEINRLKGAEGPDRLLEAFVKRLQDENASIVLQAAKELNQWLDQNQSYVHEEAMTEPPPPIVASIVRALLDACVRHSTTRPDIASICSECLGAIGCLDPDHIDADIAENQVVVLSNFEKLTEVVNWVSTLLADVFVPAFRSATNAKAQGFLAFAMQELVKFCQFEKIDSARIRSSQANPAHDAWFKIPESARDTLAPFRNSRYSLRGHVEPQYEEFPIFTPDITYDQWLRRFVRDLLWRGKGDNAKPIFALLARFIKQHDISIARFLLPYVAVNIVLGGTVSEAEQIAQELLDVLSSPSTTESRQCSEAVFSVLDYMSRWAQEKRVTIASTKLALMRAGHAPNEEEEIAASSMISSVEKVVSSIPADIIAQRAIDCGSYARALYHWEYHIREQQSRRKVNTLERDEMYRRLQSIYSEIDEPDGMDGIAAYLSVLTPEQQAEQQLRSEQYSAAQSWYEIELASRAEDHDIRVGLLTCLQRSGQFNQTIRAAKDMIQESAMPIDSSKLQQLQSFVMDVSLATGDLSQLSQGLRMSPSELSASRFSTSIGQIIMKINDGSPEEADLDIQALRTSVLRTLTTANASSLAACHTQMLQLHILHEVDRLKNLDESEHSVSQLSRSALALEQRLDILGSFTSDKQSVLAVRRSLLSACKTPSNFELGKAWLTTAKLARKADLDNVAHYAVLKASKCGDPTSIIEQAKLMWKSNQRVQALQIIQKAIDTDAFAGFDTSGTRAAVTMATQKQNLLTARAHLLLAKWLDRSGIQNSKDVTAKYQHAARYHAKWEKGHYHLGMHYLKVHEATLELPFEKRDIGSVNGEAEKIIIENFLRSMPFGSKYWHLTIPKLITLWLGLGMDCNTRPAKVSSAIFEKLKDNLALVHAKLKKYSSQIPKYAFYMALPQLISRISHPHMKVAEMLMFLIQGIVTEFPAQALWSLLPVARATAPERASRGKDMISRLRDGPKVRRADGLDMRSVVVQGARLQEALLFASEVHLEGRAANVSLSRDLGFSSKLVNNPLVVPFQHILTPNMPTVQSVTGLRNFKPFAHDKVTIASFSDDVLVLNSLQRPRKLTLRGSDGLSYGLLCKPKDDLRKDQRLMEFNTVINRALKRDPATSKRHLYIKTYGVTPLSEESGCIEWVEGIKPLRDILLKLYQRKGITPNYTELRALLNEASSSPEKYPLFSSTVLPTFPPVLHEWFTDLFPSPSTWFASRLRYTRSCAVMSFVGHVLGLGDRHGENILLQESNGGVFHVDFNCLFDKGLTFEKPELVPFRLTHNMRDAMGPTGVKGVFTKVSELTVRRMRLDQDALVSVLETFVHDPTADFVGRKKKSVEHVPDTPRGVVESVRDKLRGLVKGESVPLSDEGLVQALIASASDEGNLCRMYIGWCAFL